MKKKIHQLKEVSHRQMTKMKFLVLIQNILMLLIIDCNYLNDCGCLFSPFLTAAETAEIILLKALILQIICLYQKVVPHLVTQCKFDFSKLLKGNIFRIVCVNTVYLLIVVYIQYMYIYIFITALGIVSDKGIRDEVPPVLQYQVLQLALDLPASKFSWFRIQVVIVLLCLFQAHFGLLNVSGFFVLRILQIQSHQERSLYFTCF